MLIQHRPEYLVVRGDPTEFIPASYRRLETSGKFSLWRIRGPGDRGE